MLLLHGPVGIAKSTIARLLKKVWNGIHYQTDGALYSYEWINLHDKLKMEDTMACPIHEEPLHLIPEEALVQKFLVC